MHHVDQAMPTLFGDPSVLREQGRLRLPGWLPGLFFSCLWPGAWRLSRTDLTSLSTSVDTGYRGSPDSKSNDNACAKGGAGECRQDQNHDHPSRQENNHPQIPLSISANRHEMQIRCFKPVESPIVTSTGTMMAGRAADHATAC